MKIVWILAALSLLLSACGGKSTALSPSEDRMETEGIMEQTERGVDSPSAIRDFEESGWSQELMLRKPPFPDDCEHNTVLTATADPTTPQALYLWEEGNVPAVTRYTDNSGGYYYDDPDFRPYVTSLPVAVGTEIKGAVLLCAGGAFQFRGDYTDSIPTAEALCALGFQCFIVDYRLHPYTQEEGALDLARAVRFVRKSAEVYGFDPNHIAVMGFSAGAIQSGELLMHYDGFVNGTSLDRNYIPDALDDISADAAACGMIYGFYGRLSVGNMDPNWLGEGDLPPTFYVYGTEDPFYRQFEQQFSVIEGMGIPTDRIVLQGWPHGFGAEGGWVPGYAAWLEETFERN